METELRPTRILTRADVRTLLTAERAVAAVETAFGAHGRGETLMPPKVYIPLERYEGDFRAMPVFAPACGAAGVPAAGVKWINAHPNNPAKHGLPSVIGVFILSDPATALPLAIMDATEMTALRTGAAAAVATKHLARAHARRVGVIGCGVQARSTLACHAEIMTPSEIVVYDRRADAAAALVDEHRTLGCRAGTLQEAAACDVVCTLTPSTSPIVMRSLVAAGTHINAMGADAPGKQELDPALLRDARVFLDDLAQASESGEVNVSLRDGSLRSEQIAGTLGEVVAGSVVGREAGDDDTITVFDSTGLAVQDVAVARVVYEAAQATGVGIDVDLIGS